MEKNIRTILGNRIGGPKNGVGSVKKNEIIALNYALEREFGQSQGGAGEPSAGSSPASRSRILAADS